MRRNLRSVKTGNDVVQDRGKNPCHSSSDDTECQRATVAPVSDNQENMAQEEEAESIPLAQAQNQPDQAQDQVNTTASGAPVGIKKRSQPPAEKMWHGVRVLSQQGEFTISDLVQVCGVSYTYARKFLRYLLLKKVVSGRHSASSTSWKGVVYALVSGAEKPDPLYRDPYVVDKSTGISLATESADMSAGSGDANAVQTVAPLAAETSPLQPQSAPEPATPPCKESEEQAKSCGSPAGTGKNTESAARAEQQDQDRVKNPCHSSKVSRIILEGYYDDLINKVQYLNCLVHKIRTDTKFIHLQETYLELDAIRIAMKLYYLKMAQARELVDLSAVFAEDNSTDEAQENEGQEDNKE
ncbi:MAG: hypothetical protein AB1847_18430 [bacterium]